MSARSVRLVALLSLVGAQTACAPRCRSGRVLLTFVVDASIAPIVADVIEVQVGANTPTTLNPKTPLQTGIRLDVDLGTAYTAHTPIDLRLLARKNNSTVATGDLAMTLDDVCTAATMHLVPIQVAATESSLIATPTSLPADGVSSAQVRVQVRDEGGNPLIGQLVNLTSDVAGDTIVQPPPTDSSGSADGTLTATAHGVHTITTSFAQVAIDFTVAPAVVSALSVVTPAGSACASINFTVAQAESASADVVIEVDAGTGFRPISAAAQQSVTTSPTGIAHTIAWPSDRDVRQSGPVSVRVTPLSPTVGVAVQTMASLSNGPTYKSAVDTAITPEPNAVALADFNQDGKSDLATAQAAGPGWTISFGNGDGTFQAPQIFVETAAFKLIAADFDGDGDIDLAGIGGATLTVAHNDGHGVFDLPPPAPNISGPGYADSQTFGNGATVLDFTAFNLNTMAPVDDLLDIALLVRSSNGTVFIWIDQNATTNAGYFGLGGVVTNDFGQQTSITAARIDGDAHEDLVLGSYGDKRVTVLLRPTGSISNSLPRVDSPIFDTPTQLLLVDLDNDHVLDIVAPNGNSQVVTVLKGVGDGSFTAKTRLTAGFDVYQTIAVDLNGDGKIDFAAPHADGVTAWLSNGDFTFGALATSAPPLSAPTNASIAVAMVDNDAFPDFAIPRHGARIVPSIYPSSCP